MINPIFFFHILLVICALIIIYFSYDLHKKYPLPFLSHFFFYLTAVYIYWFVAFILPSQLVQFFGENYRISEPFIYWLFIFFSLPCALMVHYFFLSFFIQIVDKPYRPRLIILILLPLIAGSLGIGIILIFTIDTFEISRFANVYFGFRTLGYAFRFGTIAFGFLAANRLSDAKKKHLIRILCIYFFFWFLFYFLIRVLIPSYDRFLLDYVYPFLYFLSNIPALILIQKYIRKTFSSHRLPDKNRIDFEWIFKRYNLTGREQEVFRSLVVGKSNKEIADELFISDKTVKNHIYNVFKKLGVNNRTKFSIFIQNIVDSK